jgi:hypothetical protein
MSSDPLKPPSDSSVRVARVIVASEDAPPELRAAAKGLLEAREKLVVQLRELGFERTFELVDRWAQNRAELDKIVLDLELLDLHGADSFPDEWHLGPPA